MNENGKLSALYSWPVIIIALFAFWPVGLFLLIKRVDLDKTTAMGAGKLIGIIGACAYAMATLGLLVSISDGFDSTDVTMIIFFAAAGFVLRKWSKKIRNNAESIKKYLAIIVNGNTRQLDVIASSTGKSYDVVKKDVQHLIDKGYLKNAYINEGTREVVLPIKNVSPQYVAAPMVNSAAVPVQPRIVSCPCCGANNTVTGALGECEYCGSPLE